MRGIQYEPVDTFISFKMGENGVRNGGWFWATITITTPTTTCGDQIFIRKELKVNITLRGWEGGGEEWEGGENSQTDKIEMQLTFAQ